MKIFEELRQAREEFGLVVVVVVLLDFLGIMLGMFGILLGLLGLLLLLC